MPRKAVQEEEYDPIKAEVVRNAAARAPEPAAPETRRAPPPPPRREPPSNPRAPVAPAFTTSERGAGSTGRGREESRPRGRRKQGGQEEVKADPARRLVYKHFKCTEEEDLEISDFIRRLQHNSRSKVTFSVIARSLFLAAMQAEEELMTEIAKGGPMTRPANDDEESMARFEDKWFQKLAAALRRARPPQAGISNLRGE
jgi:hypothetical protein